MKGSKSLSELLRFRVRALYKDKKHNFKRRTSSQNTDLFQREENHR